MDDFHIHSARDAPLSDDFSLSNVASLTCPENVDVRVARALWHAVSTHSDRRHSDESFQVRTCVVTEDAEPPGVVPVDVQVGVPEPIVPLESHNDFTRNNSTVLSRYRGDRKCPANAWAVP